MFDKVIIALMSLIIGCLLGFLFEHGMGAVHPNEIQFCRENLEWCAVEQPKLHEVLTQKESDNG